MIEKVMEFWSQHVLFSTTNHFAAGFGLALVLQRYIKGNPFLPTIVGWLLFGYGLIAHIYAFAQ